MILLFALPRNARRKLKALTSPSGVSKPKPTPLESFQKQAAEKESAERGRAKELIGTQFGQARKVLGAARDVTQQRLDEELARRQAISGGPSGASDKIRRKALTQLGRSFGQEAAGLEAQQAAALQQAEEGIAGRSFGREQLGLQESQFGRQFGLQQQAMDLQKAEFRENLKTNFVNTAVALWDAGLKTADDWAKLLRDGYGFLSEFSPDLAPNVTSKEAVTGVPGGPKFGGSRFE